MSDTKSVSSPEVTICVYALTPAPGRTPWWAKRTQLTYSHICLSVDMVVWEQPMGQLRGVRGRAHDAEVWAKSAFAVRRAFKAVAVTLPVTPEQLQAMSDTAEGLKRRRSQPLRTALRYLGLWPRPAWNCTSPVRAVFGALGVTLRGETPDDLIREVEALSDDSAVFAGVAGELG